MNMAQGIGFLIKNKGKSLESLIDDLVKVGVFTDVKAKRVKSFARIRNHALHAEWDEFASAILLGNCKILNRSGILWKIN
jgi:polyhydroxyalkanoate synthesis regulator phasin